MHGGTNLFVTIMLLLFITHGWDSMAVWCGPCCGSGQAALLLAASPHCSCGSNEVQLLSCPCMCGSCIGTQTTAAINPRLRGRTSGRRCHTATGSTYRCSSITATTTDTTTVASIDTVGE